MPPATPSRPDEDPSQAILDHILAEMDGGRVPDGDELARRFPGHEETVERLARAAGRYARAAARLRPGPAPADAGREAPALAPGTAIGDFVVEVPIGRGGMGRVYRARQRSLGDRRVALKVLPVRGSEGDERAEREAAARFAREARAASSLHHPNLAEIYGSGTEDGLHYYAMRLVEGPTVREVLEELAADRALARDPAVRRRLVQRVREVAAALERVHRAGLVHRDVKPANMMLEGPGEPFAGRPAVLVDFGLVRPVDTEASTLSGHAPATPAYAAPEVLLGKDVDARADVFGLGATLHDLLAARRPQDRSQASAGLEPLGDCAVEIDPDLAAIVAVATDPMPEWRYPDAAALGRDLDAWLAGLPVAARTPGPVEAALRWSRRHPWALLRGAAAAAALALVAVLALGAASVRSDVARAHGARASGDVAGLVASLAAVPRPLRGAWLLGPELADLARRLDAPADAAADSAGDLDVELCRRVRAGAEGPALEHAARALERYGLDDRPLCARFLERELARGTPVAVAAAARLFAARPVRTPRDVEVSATLRARLLDVVELDAAPLAVRLEALSALAGCGTPAEAHRLAEWAGAGAASAEARRLTLRALERIARRTHGCATLSELAPEDLARHVARLAPEDARPGPAAEQEREAWFDLLRALAFAARARDESLPLEAFPAALFEPRRWDDLRAALGEPAALEALERSAAEADPSALDPWRLGWRAGALADGALTRSARAALEPRDDRASAGARFEAGLAYAEAEARGLREELDAPFGDDASSPPRRAARTGWEPLIPRVAAAPRSPEFLAVWDFRADPGTCQGWAGGAESYLVRRGAPAEDGVALELAVLGQSEVRLLLHVPPESPPRGAALFLSHERVARTHLSWGGTAVLEVALDGVPLDPGRGVHRTELATDAVLLPDGALAPGDHVVSIRLVEATAPYRLARAWLAGSTPRPAPESGSLARGGAAGPASEGSLPAPATVPAAAGE